MQATAEWVAAGLMPLLADSRPSGRNGLHCAPNIVINCLRVGFKLAMRHSNNSATFCSLQDQHHKQHHALLPTATHHRSSTTSRRRCFHRMTSSTQQQRTLSTSRLPAMLQKPESEKVWFCGLREHGNSTCFQSSVCSHASRLSSSVACGVCLPSAIQMSILQSS